MNVILREIEFSTQQVIANNESIKKTREKLNDWVGKPVHQGALDSIERWEKESIEHLDNLDIFFSELREFRKKLTDSSGK